MKPTVISPTAIPAATGVLPVVDQSGETSALTTTASNATLTMLGTKSSIVLDENQLAAAENMLSGLDFATIKAADIALIGDEAHRALSAMLDEFLAGITRFKNPKLLSLFENVSKGIDDAKLPKLLKRIQSGKLGFWSRIRCGFSKKKIAQAAKAAYETTCDLVSGRSNQLSTFTKSMEKELMTEQDSLLEELRRFDALQSIYGDRIKEFAVAAAVAQVFLLQSRAYVERRRAEIAGVRDPLAISEFEQLERKLQLLESRALSLEGVYSKLPGDQVLIQQIEDAGISTLQETATTSTERFSSIKTTLIALHGALSIQGLQQRNAEYAQTDRQLAEVRAAVTREVVTTAANAPGDNRLAQAAHLKSIVDLAKDLRQTVKTARQTNSTKFESARQMFESARTELNTLSDEAKA